MLLDRTEWVDNLGDPGPRVMACGKGEALVTRVCLFHRFDVPGALMRFPEATDGMTMDLAWFLTGVSYAVLAEPGRTQQGLRTPAEAARKSCCSPTRGSADISGHQSRHRGVRGRVRGRIGSFADQVYPIYALSIFAQAFDDRDALRHASACADGICRVQGPTRTVVVALQRKRRPSVSAISRQLSASGGHGANGAVRT